MRENPTLAVSFRNRLSKETIEKVSQSLQVKRGPQPTKPTLFDQITAAQACGVAARTPYTGPVIRRKARVS